jgi:uncharacterized protein involved in outer membrane biogenesis
MRIVFRLFLGLLGLIVIAAVGAAIWARFFLDADVYRPQIETQIEAQLGRDIELGPGLSVSLLPWLGVETGAVRLANVDGAEAPMLQARRARVAVRVLPLLTGAIEADTVELDGVVLHLQRDAAGKGNWEFAQPAAASDSAASSDPAKSALALAAIGGVRMQNAEIHWRDAQAGQVVALRDVNLEAGAYRSESDWPIQLSADYQLAEGQSAQRGRFTLDTNLSVDATAKKLTLKALSATLNDSTLKGELTVLLGHAIPGLRFNLSLDRLDIDRYLKSSNEAASSQAKIDPVTAAAAAATQLPVALVRQLDVDGRLRVDWLRGFGLEVENATVVLQAKDGVLSLEPLRGDFYRGSYDGVVALDARAEPATVRMQEKIQNVDAGALITALTGQSGLRGRMNTELDVQAQGADTQALLETLQGEVRADLSEAVLEGINLGQLVRQAAAAIEGQPMPQSDAANETRLVDLQLVSYVHNGVAQVERLLASTDLLMLTGEGQINLLEQTLALNLQAEVALNEAQGLPKELRRLQGKPFPIKLTGAWNAPKVEVDVEQALKAVVQEKLQEKLEREIQERFGGAGLFDLLGGQGGFLSAPVEEGPRPVRPVAPNLPNAPQAPSNAAPTAEVPAEPVAEAAPSAPEKTDAQKLEEQLQRGLEDALRGLFR